MCDKKLAIQNIVYHHNVLQLTDLTVYDHFINDLTYSKITFFDDFEKIFIDNFGDIVTINVLKKNYISFTSMYSKIYLILNT